MIQTLAQKNAAKNHDHAQAIYGLYMALLSLYMAHIWPMHDLYFDDDDGDGDDGDDDDDDNDDDDNDQ